jgi:hypothetical protein
MSIEERVTYYKGDETWFLNNKKSSKERLERRNITPCPNKYLVAFYCRSEKLKLRLQRRRNDPNTLLTTLSKGILKRKYEGVVKGVEGKYTDYKKYKDYY